MSHQHHHGHRHDHGPDCTCGCHGGQDAHNLIDGALVLSRTWSREGCSPISGAALEGQVTDGLCQIAGLLAEDGVIFGHIKALLRCGEDSVALSITRLDGVDRIAAGTWPPPAPVTGWTLTVNVLSLAHTDAVDLPLLDRLFAGESSHP